VLECLQADGHLRAASGRWVRQVAAVAQRHGALLVVDDRTAGGGRCGGFFSFEGMGVMPDLVLPTQSLSGLGLPMGLLLVRPDRDRWAPAELSSQFQHNHHAFVAAGVACQKFWSDERLQNAVSQRAALLAAGLQGVAELLPLPPDRRPLVVGRGLLQGLRLGDATLARQVVALCFRRGLVVGAGGPDGSLLRVMPPLTIPTLLLEQGLAILHRSVAEATGQRARSAPHQALSSVRAAARRAAASTGE
jgi:diaminobutyrate-2-oxoglutarate transaminase